MVDCKQADCPTSKNYIKPKSIAPAGTYGNGSGYVYIVADDQLNEIQKDKEPNVAIIVDKRNNTDPNMQIIESYKISNKKQQSEIIDIMIDYNTNNPSNPGWNRTKESLLKEWEIHNTVYALGFYRSHTADCDFNNADEGQGYIDFFVKRVLKW